MITYSKSIRVGTIVIKLRWVWLCIPYSQKIWRGIKFGGLAVLGETAKLKSAKIYTAYMYVYMAILFQTAKFKSSNTQFGGQTAKFNDRQYFWLYGSYIFVPLAGLTKRSLYPLLVLNLLPPSSPPQYETLRYTVPFSTVYSCPCC